MRILCAGAAALALVLVPLVGTPVAQAQEPTDCAAAVIALNAADVAHREALDADEKAEKAEKADEELEAAEKERTAALANVGQFNTRNKAQNRVNEIDAELASGNPSAEQERALKDERKDLVRFIEADKRFERAVDAAKSDAADLRRKADRTDAQQTKAALDDARADFDRLLRPCADHHAGHPGAARYLDHRPGPAG